MNYAEKAKQLQEERLEKERLEEERQAKEKQETAEKKGRMSAAAKQKTEELLPLFKQFAGFKIFSGHVTVEPEVKYPNGGGALTCLKAGSVGSSALGQFSAGALLLSAYYDAQSESYHLNRFENRARVAGSPILVGKYKNTDDLMNAVTTEISKL